MLYAKDSKNNIRYWNISLKYDDVDNPTIIKSYGIEGGKDVTTKTVVSVGKNIGKKNETTPLEQARLMVDSLIKKKMDEGYVNDKSMLNDMIILPMLANNWKPTNAHDVVYIQPKLDGVRMMVGRVKGEIIAMSRTGKRLSSVIDPNRFARYIPNEGDFLDGENYNHEMDFEEITGICRTSLETSIANKNTSQLEFHVFDIFNINNLTEPFQNRLERLRELHYPFTVTTKLIRIDAIEKWHDYFTRLDYEGMIIRTRNGGYDIAQRSRNLFKYKKFQSDEYEIVGHTEARGRDIGTIIWRCKTVDDKEFSVRPKGSIEQRKEWLNNASTYYGKLLTVQFQNMTNGTVPRFPVGMAIRDYE